MFLVELIDGDATTFIKCCFLAQSKGLNIGRVNFEMYSTDKLELAGYILWIKVKRL